MKQITATHGILAILVVFSLIGLLLVAAPLWQSLLVAVLLAYLLNPVVAWLERRWPGKRPLLATLVYIAAVLLLLGLLSLAGAFLLDAVPGWGEELREALVALELWLERPLPLFGFTLQPQIILDYLQRAGSNALGNIPTGSTSLIGGLTDNLLWSLVIFISLYYFLRDGPRLKTAVFRYIPPHWQEEADFLWEEISQIWGVFLRVQLLIFVVLAVLIGISTSLIIWLYRQGWLPLSPFGIIILLILVYTAIQQVDNLWLRPKYMGQALQLHTGVVIVTLIASLTLTGLLGTLISIPLLATVKFLAQYIYRRLGYAPTDPIATETAVSADSP